MADIDELQRRITAALQRIESGVDAVGASGGDDAGSAAEAAELRQALEEEKLVTAQLEERVKALKERYDAELEEARSQNAGQTEAMAQVDAELQKLRRATEVLRENNQALREANEAGVSEPHLINKAMLAELEALRAERAAEVAETSAILAAMAPLVQQGETA